MSKPIIETTDYWQYIPGFIDKDIFPELLKEVTPLVAEYGGTSYYTNKPFTARRLSYKLSDIKKEKEVKESTKGIVEAFDYSIIKLRDWKESPIVCDIKKQIEEKFDEKYDYCLVHLYRDGTDSINYHQDRESLKNCVVSISVGATRKFRFRKIEHKNGYAKEFNLKSGDLLYMKIGCQQKYKHSVPVEKTVKEPRINLTFRKFQ